MNVQENKIRIFIQTAAMLRLRDSANQDREISNKRFEEKIKQGRTEEAIDELGSLMGGFSLSSYSAALDKAEEELVEDIKAGRFSSSERRRTVDYLKSKEGKDHLAKHHNVKGFLTRFIGWDNWLP